MNVNFSSNIYLTSVNKYYYKYCYARVTLCSVEKFYIFSNTGSNNNNNLNCFLRPLAQKHTNISYIFIFITLEHHLCYGIFNCHFKTEFK